MAFDLNMAIALDLVNEHFSEDQSSASRIISSSDGDDENIGDIESLVESPDKSMSNKQADPNSPLSKDVSFDDTGVGGLDSNAELTAELEAKLEGGACFGSLEQAHLFYCEYGRQKGFSVRRGNQRYKGTSEDLRWKEFVCYCAGLPNGGKQHDTVRGFKKLVKRSQCTAKIRVHPLPEGIWKITLFKKDHNHPLLAPDQSYLLRSSRILSESRLGVLQSMNSVGIPVNMAQGFMEVECGGPQNVGYIRKDAYNKLWLAKRDKHVVDGDAIALLEFFNSKTNAEPCFFWRARYDDERRLRDFFFRDTRCLSDYECFGDVLSVDTTYKTNKYNLYCAPFVGLNHHSTNIMFGVGFLSDETSKTFEWLLGVFLESMNGKHPKVVFSDQCRALMNAIDRIFPHSIHRLCQWHVNNNAFKHFGPLNQNEPFKKMWYRCMNWVETEEEFDNVWAEMMATHVPARHTWLPEMHTLRRRWAAVFSQNTFTAGMLSTSRSEGTNRVLKAMIRSSTSLHGFALAYEKIQTRWREGERADDAQSLWQPGQFVKKNDLLTHAASVYTRKIYKKFEVQCREVFNVVIDWKNAVEIGNGHVKFKATRNKYPNSRARTVTFNHVTKLGRCSCYMWESHGILCRHVLAVYQHMNVQEIPEELIMKRWTKNAKDIAFLEQAASIHSHNNLETKFMDFTNFLMRSQYEMVVAAKDSDSAQEYLIQMIQRTKEGFQASVLGEQSAVAVCLGDAPAEKFQFRNPNKVKPKCPADDEKNPKKTSNRKRQPKRKCPGKSTRSRKRRNCDDGPSFSGLDLNISLSQPVQNSGFGRNVSQPFEIHEEDFDFFVR